MWITVLLTNSKLSQELQLIFFITSHLKSKGKGEAMAEKRPFSCISMTAPHPRLWPCHSRLF